MTVIAMRKELTEYLQTAEAEKVKAIFDYVKDEIKGNRDEWDEEFIKELERREKSFLDGSAKMYTLEDAKKIARERFKAKSKH